MKKEECFFLGIISKKHGYKGDVNIKLNVNASEKYKELDYLFIDLNGNLVPFFISSLRFKNHNIALVKFEDVNATGGIPITKGVNVVVFGFNATKFFYRKYDNEEYHEFDHYIKDD